MIPVLALLFTVSGYGQAIRPVWNIGHMVNNKNQVLDFLNLGANAVETDIKFGSDGTALYTSHGIPCDCGRDCLRWDYFTDFLDYISDLTSPENPRFQPKFVLQALDLKLNGFDTYGKSRALADLARKLVWHLWKNGTSTSKVNLLIHLPSTSGLQSVHSFYRELDTAGLGAMSQRIGWEVYSSEPVEQIRKLWDQLNVSSNNWQGDGITNCLPRSPRRLQDAVISRDNPKSTLSKVYYWTVDRRSTMRTTLKLGVDGVVTNYPNRLVEVLQEPEMKGLARLATIEDNPFQRYEPEVRAKKIIQMPEYFLNREDDDVENINQVF